MADSDEPLQIDPTEIEILIEKLEQNKLEEYERRLIVALLGNLPVLGSLS